MGSAWTTAFIGLLSCYYIKEEMKFAKFERGMQPIWFYLWDPPFASVPWYVGINHVNALKSGVNKNQE